jgi:Fe-S cluster biogenesis protein NfuA
MLLLAGAALGAAVVKIAGNGTPSSQAVTASQIATDTAQERTPQAVTDGVLVYLFHGNVRCPTCLLIEASTKEVLETNFAQELNSRKVVIRELNYEKPENRQFIQKYKLIAPTVVMVRIHDGEEKDFVNLMEVWQCVGNKEAFARLISDNLKNMLQGTTS